MNHAGTQTLNTERLALRRFTVEDAGPMFQSWANDGEVTRYLSWEPHGDVSVTRALLEDWVAAYPKPDYYSWAIEYDGELVGSIGLLAVDDERREAEAGYCMAKAHWGKGVMPEALRAVLGFAFGRVGFARILAKHHVDNTASGAVMKKSGMRYVERAMCPLALKPGTEMLCDCYEITRKAWDAAQQ